MTNSMETNENGQQYTDSVFNNAPFWSSNLSGETILELASDFDKDITIKLHGSTPIPNSNPKKVRDFIANKISDTNRIKEVRFSRAGDLLISTSSTDTALEALKISSFGDIPVVTCVLTDSLSSRYFVRGVPTSVELSEVAKELEHNDLTPLNIRRILRNKQPTTSIIVTSLGSSMPAELKLWYQLFRPDLFIERPQLCLRCFQFSHRTKFCRLSSPLCLYCGENHLAKDCKGVKRCKNCN